MNNFMLTNQITLKEINKFLERHKLQNLTQEETKNLNRPVISRQVELAI